MDITIKYTCQYCKQEIKEIETEIKGLVIMHWNEDSNSYEMISENYYWDEIEQILCPYCNHMNLIYME